MTTMNARERMLAVIHHQPVDRIPTDIWATPEVWAKLRHHFGEKADIGAELHLDSFGGVGPEYIGPATPPTAEGEAVDCWGIRTQRVPHEGGAYDEQNFYPLADAETIDDLRKYRWPQADWFDYSKMRADAAEQGKDRAVMCGYMAPFYYHNLLRGLEQSLIDPLTDPEFTHYLIGRISDFFHEHHRRMFEACEGLIDVAQVTDDLGSQSGPLIGLDLYKEFYAPHHKRLIDLCHQFGVKVFHHDDGSCRPFLPCWSRWGSTSSTRSSGPVREWTWGNSRPSSENGCASMARSRISASCPSGRRPRSGPRCGIASILLLPTARATSLPPATTSRSTRPWKTSSPCTTKPGSTER